MTSLEKSRFDPSPSCHFLSLLLTPPALHTPTQKTKNMTNSKKVGEKEKKKLITNFEKKWGKKKVWVILKKKMC